VKNTAKIKQVISLYKPFTKYVAGCLFVVAILNVISILSTWLFGRLIDSVNSFESMIKVLIMIFSIRVLYALLSYALTRVQDSRIAFRVQSYARELSLGVLRKLSIGQLRGQDSGRIQSIVEKGESSFSQLMFYTVFSFIPQAIFIIFSVIALVIMEWKIGLIAVSGAVLYLIQTKYMTKYLHKKVKSLHKINNGINSGFKEILDRMFVIKVSAKESGVTNHHIAKYNRHNFFGENMWYFWEFRNIFRDILIHFVMILVMAVSVFGVYTGEYQVGSIVVFWSLAARSVMNLGQLSGIHRRIMENWSRVSKFIDLMNVEPVVKEHSNPISRARFHGDIHFQNVEFVYESGELQDVIRKDKKKKDQKPLTSNDPVLRDISLDIKAGEKVALVGKSGSGKSTMIQLLLRGYDPQRGVITVDGFDLKRLKLDSFRNQVGVVEQNVELFNKTLRDNLLFGLPSGVDSESITDEVLMEVCERARITDFWDRLKEKGLNTMIGENGVLLSGGERQRVGIARALIKEPSILILDEATSNLDTHTERRIKDALDEASKGKTTIIIAHRLSTVRDADKIVVLEKGRIVGVGKHEYLEKDCSQYQELVQNQVW
jgi:ABC-type multidrug transport system fused ATPase/permease subunit